MRSVVAGTSSGRGSSPRPPSVCRRQGGTAPVVVLSGILALIANSPLFAQTGLNLSWGECGYAGAVSKTFACNTNTGSHVLVASFAAGPGLCLVGCWGQLDLQTSGAVLPAWWQFRNSGFCRQTALSGSAEFSSPACLGIWQSVASFGVAAYEIGLGGANRARVTASVSLPIECQALPGGTETGAFKLILNNDKTIGTGACPGCEENACIVFNSLHLTLHDLTVTELDVPLDRNFVTWQGELPDCPGATPARNRTWGAVKTLYR